MNPLEQEIIDVIAEEGGIDKSDITRDSNLYDLGIDSLSSLEILVALETRYDITIPQNRLRDVNSVKEIITVVVSEINKKK
ncbi:MAG: acyl carrier protein, partial [Dehalococcoidales bacterium]|nr:acyl carrier protein [Dehalococcoidales bacterium]